MWTRRTRAVTNVWPDACTDACADPDAPHYGHPAWVLGEDDFGVWCEVRAGLPWRRGETVLFDGPFDAVVLVSSRIGFIAWFWTEVEVGELDLHVDIVTKSSARPRRSRLLT